MRNETIVDIMRQWADWRRVYLHEELGYGPTVTGRMIDGMRSTTCPRCQGDGTVVIPRNNRHERVVCPTCEGACRVSAKSSESQINPAFIRATHVEDCDPQSERVDALVCRLTVSQRAVIMQEYCRDGRREDKAGRLGYRPAWFETELEAAHTEIMGGLGIGVRRDRAS